MKPLKCPYCSSVELSTFESTATMKTLICQACKKSVVVKTGMGQVLEVAAPGLGVVTGAAAILAFFNIHNINELLDALDL